MTILIVYSTFIVLIIILLIIITYFINALIKKNHLDYVIAKELVKIENLFYKHMEKEDLKKLNKNQIKDLQEIVLTKNGLLAFNICYNNYIKKYGESDKLKDYVDMIIDYKVIHENHVVKEKYKDSYTLYLLFLYKIISKEALDYAHESLIHNSLYSRNNALRVIQNSKDEFEIIKALNTINNQEYYYNDKIIIDFMTEFKGNREDLTLALLNNLDSFNERIKRIIIDYFTSVEDKKAELKILKILDLKSSLELRLAAIKYFGKVINKDAYQLIIDGLDDINWEVRAVCGKIIEAYSNDVVIKKLREKLTDSNWFVRFNCALSLINLTKDAHKAEILEINDNYAKEIYIYALFSKEIITIKEYNELLEEISRKAKRESEILINKDNKKIIGREIKREVEVG
ncbi:MAG: HEAT repeat domain-containing protein [Bacilli bacterium]|nr:HEAT repeat domain-containing protein [Bacilli bacterium]MDD4719142.1 HEAT repeat domain-containing protein [Bacilli bacterium]